MAACVDTDSDGVNDLLDIDDDNDGVLDATESPSCYYLAGEITSNMSVSTTIATYNTTSWGIQTTIDNNTGTRVQYNRIASIVGEEVFKLEFITPIKLASFELDMSDYPISGATGTYVNTTMLQGSSDGTNWFDLQTAATSLTTTNGIETIQNTEQPNTAYQYYRLLGVTGRPDHGRIKEITPILNNFNASLYPKDNCSVDTDNDGTYNHLDTDSDGDTCIDTIEAGTSNDGTTTDANNNGLLDQYEDGTTGTINYTSTYNAYAINDAINACADTDGDGVNDVFDLDDDNDGILDVVEMLSVEAALWLDASDPSSITKDSNGLVSQWNDKSGNGNQLLQTTSQQQPTHSGSEVNFSVANNMDFTSNLPSTWWAITIGSPGPINSFRSLVYTGTGNTPVLVSNGDSSFGAYESSFGQAGSITWGVGETAMMAIDANGTNTQISKNAGQFFATGKNPNNAAVNFGGIGTNNTQSFGVVNEFILFSAEPSEDDRQKIEGYLAHKWGLVASLPADHPYKNATPSNDVDGDGIPNSLDLDSDGRWYTRQHRGTNYSWLYSTRKYDRQYYRNKYYLRIWPYANRHRRRWYSRLLRYR